MDRVRRYLSQPVIASVLLAIVLHALWFGLIANGGGDLAAQDAWAAFAKSHPLTAYDLAWYGGIHPGSYSVLSPYVMALLGVRTTMFLAGVIGSGLLAQVLVQTRAISRPMLPALYGTLALACNAISGRVTFGLGLVFGLATLVIVFSPPGVPITRARRTRRGLLAGVLAALATMSSPVAGLFLGVVAAALWLRGRRRIAYAVGLPPVAVVLIATLLFPFSGEQPMKPASAILPVLIGVSCAMLTPKSWRSLRLGAWFYTLGVIAVLVVPSQIGSNVTRLALIFGGVVLVAVAAELLPLATWRSPALIVAILVATGWQAGVAGADIAGARSANTISAELQPLVRQLKLHHADLARVEVVPSRSHREASALAPHVNLARGWNRQADAGRNALFYREDALTATTYHQWLNRWAVHFVFLTHGDTDPAATAEADLIRGGLPYLRQVWVGAGGQLFVVKKPTPLVDAPATVTRFGAGEVVVKVPRPGTYRLKVLSSPWLALIDEDGHIVPRPKAPEDGTFPVNVHGCLSSRTDPALPGGVELTWTLLEAPRAGTYRISTPYAVRRGTACPSVTADQR